MAALPPVIDGVLQVLQSRQVEAVEVGIEPLHDLGEPLIEFLCLGAVFDPGQIGDPHRLDRIALAFDRALAVQQRIAIGDNRIHFRG